MIKRDERTPAQRATHQWAVVARDTLMSGWGEAKGGTSRCAWAVPEFIDLDQIENWVRGRREMLNVHIVHLDGYRPPRGTAHFSIYVVGPTHPAVTGAMTIFSV